MDPNTTLLNFEECMAAEKAAHPDEEPASDFNRFRGQLLTGVRAACPLFTPPLTPLACLTLVTSGPMRQSHSALEMYALGMSGIAMNALGMNGIAMNAMSVLAPHATIKGAAPSKTAEERRAEQAADLIDYCRSQQLAREVFLQQVAQRVQEQMPPPVLLYLQSADERTVFNTQPDDV